MFDILTDAEEFTREGELFLDGLEGVDFRLGIVGAEEVPGEEAGEVLEGSDGLVATGWLDVSWRICFVVSQYLS